MENKKRLIDANDLWSDIMVLPHNGDMISSEEVEQAIMDAPTVDAVEVVHGRWIETLVPDGYVQKASRLRKQCSVCGWTNACRYNYCPNCGADMRERKDNGQD